MTDLSPAAQAVLTAQAKERCLFEWSTVNDPPCHPSDSEWNGCIQCVDRRGIAAALRAAADQVVPEFWHEDEDIYGWTMQDIRKKLFAIADELEGKPEEPKYLAENLAMFNPFDPEKRL
jgi:hypothetical protein